MTEEKIKQLVIDNMKYEQLVLNLNYQIFELKEEIKKLKDKNYYKNYYEGEIYEIIGLLQNIVGDDK